MAIELDVQGIPETLPGGRSFTMPKVTKPIYRGIVIALCEAFTPAATGPDTAEVPVPYAPDGQSVIVWAVSRFNVRVVMAGTSSAVNLEKSSGTGPFAPFTLASVTISGAANEAHAVGNSGLPVKSGEKLRFNVITLGSAQNWTITVELRATAIAAGSSS